jgi:hypothetical protein
MPTRWLGSTEEGKRRREKIPKSITTKALCSEYSSEAKFGQRNQEKEKKQ